MTYSKPVLTKLISLVEELSKEPNNEWFKKDLLSKITNSSILNVGALDDIYEYCIKLIIKDQAQKFYRDFKIASLKETLELDFIRMEQFRRQDNFEDFCMAAYQQVEAIVNNLFDSISLDTYLRRNHLVPAIHKYSQATKTFVRSGPETLGQLIFKTGEVKKIESGLSKPASNWFFSERLRMVLYAFYFNYEVKFSKVEFEKVYDLGIFLYQGRNLNHRGSSKSDYQQKILDEMLPNKHRYYFRFLGFLEDFVEKVNVNV
jgi:hypothetical protein